MQHKRAGIFKYIYRDNLVYYSFISNSKFVKVLSFYVNILASGYVNHLLCRNETHWDTRICCVFLHLNQHSSVCLSDETRHRAGRVKQIKFKFLLHDARRHQFPPHMHILYLYPPKPGPSPSRAPAAGHPVAPAPTCLFLFLCSPCASCQLAVESWQLPSLRLSSTRPPSCGDAGARAWTGRSLPHERRAVFEAFSRALCQRQPQCCEYVLSRCSAHFLTTMALGGHFVCTWHRRHPEVCNTPSPWP